MKALTEAGLAVGFGVAGCLLLFFIIKHILRQQEKILDMATLQNENWQRALNDHTAQATKFHEQVTEAHKFQREEHRDIQKCLLEIAAMLGGKK